MERPAEGLSPDQAEIRREGERDGGDPTTDREELELDLMEADASEAGEEIGDETG